MPAFLLGIDTVSRGAGSARLGRHGYTHVGASTTPVVWTPGGGGLSLSWAAGATAATDFASTADPPRYLLLPDGSSTTSRSITRSFNPPMRLAATVSDGLWRVVSIYCWSNNATYRQGVELRLPGLTSTLASAILEPDFSAGVWMRFAFNESTDVTLTQYSGPTCCAGIYFDPHPVHLAGPPPSNAFGHFAH